MSPSISFCYVCIEAVEVQAGIGILPWHPLSLLLDP